MTESSGNISSLQAQFFSLDMEIQAALWIAPPKARHVKKTSLE